MAVFQRKGRDETNGYNVHSKVHQMQEAGFSQRSITKALGINCKTVKRHWDMDVEQYEHNTRKIVRIRNLDLFLKILTVFDKYLWAMKVLTNRLV